MVNQIKENETVRACSINGSDKNIYKIFVKKYEGKRPLERAQYKKKIVIIDFKAVS